MNISVQELEAVAAYQDTDFRQGDGIVDGAKMFRNNFFAAILCDSSAFETLPPSRADGFIAPIEEGGKLQVTMHEGTALDERRISTPHNPVQI